MYGIKWNSNINGFTLVPLSEAEPIASLRPVFFEELDLLGFNEFWKYPKSKEPLLWFCTLNRTYYYKGNKVAKAKGGGFFQKPELEIYEKNLILEPINLESLVSENYKILQIFTNFALDFVGDVYEKHKNRICIVGFSGGKDSTVLLDLIQRVLSPIKFLVIFNDTSMELSSTYQFWEIIKSQYPNLKFITAKHEKDPLIAWDEFGIPSRIQRWCCTVYKMIPTVKILKQLFPEKTKILFFDGIRTDESPKRKSLEHISQGKYFNQLNVHPLLNWTLELIWLYIFHRNLPINSAYRYGISRIGCIVCPFESEWKETIIWLKYKDEAIPYLQKIIKYAEAKGIKDIENFVKEGNWKVRTDGKGWHKSKIIILEDKENIKLYTKDRKNFFEWLKIIKSTVRENYFTIFIDQKEYLIKYNLNDENLEIELNKKNNEEIFPLIKKLINKSAYCVKCRYCEIICPKNAITFNPEIKIKDNCSHCLRCLDIIVKGCLVAKSLDIIITKEEMVNMYKLRDYCTFGMRKVWLEEFFRGAEKWLMGENSCGPVQFEAMKR
ncbi:MAG: phosphoadenosine phosphosulfate reductase family protein, partial [Candidatus Omnitrophica bacterium]|nr:phosphoadenosine phosphosulfate reductase family protein [Candidatus Omnitrophota bacterium]